MHSRYSRVTGRLNSGILTTHRPLRNVSIRVRLAAVSLVLLEPPRGSDFLNAHRNRSFSDRFYSLQYKVQSG